MGKTTLGLQFLLHGAAAGEQSLYVTLAETAEELDDVATSHGWSLDQIKLLELVSPADAAIADENTLFHAADLELGETVRGLLSELERLKPARVVIDSLSELRLLAQSPLRYRRQILALKRFFMGRQCTVLLLDDRTSEQNDLQLQSIAHGVVSLEQLSPLYGAERRRLRVVKLRGVRFRGGYHDFGIQRGGLSVFPRLVASEHRKDFDPEQQSSGVPELDALFGGGLSHGTSTVLVGPAGSGKSTIAVQFGCAAAAAGKRVAMFAFDEGRTTVLARAEALGLGLAKHIDANRFHLQQIDPAELPPGEFFHLVRQKVERDGAQMVIIDSLNGYIQAMPEEQFLVLQLHEMLSYLAQQGIITILVMAQQGTLGAMQGPVDISYLADTVVLLRHFEAGGRIRRAISMLKKRSGHHETTIREMMMSTGRGIQIGPPLEQFEGVLTGVPRYVGSQSPLIAEDDGGES